MLCAHQVGDRRGSFFDRHGGKADLWKGGCKLLQIVKNIRAGAGLEEQRENHRSPFVELTDVEDPLPAL